MNRSTHQVLLLMAALFCLSLPAWSGTITGVIKSASGRPVADVRVRAWDKDPATRDEIIGKGITDKQGRYRIQYTNRRWDGPTTGTAMTTSRPDIYITAEIRIRGQWEEIGRSAVNRDHRQSRTLVINLKNADRMSAFTRRTIYGVIRDRKGRPIGGMTVRAWDKDFLKTPELMGSARTNRRGQYRIVYQKRRWDGPKTGFNLGTTANPDIFITVQKKRKGTTLVKSKLHRDYPTRKELRINLKLP